MSGDLGVGEQRADERRELLPRHLHAVVLVDAGGATHDLAERAVRRLLLVRQAAAPQARARPRVLDSAATSRASRDLPIPAGPSTVTRCGVPALHGAVPDRCGSAAPPVRVRRAGSPTSGAPAGDTSDRSTSHAATGSRLPFASTAGSSRKPNA